MLPLFMKPRFISLNLLYNILFTSFPLPSKLSYRGVIPDTITSAITSKKLVRTSQTLLQFGLISPMPMDLYHTN